MKEDEQGKENKKTLLLVRVDLDLILLWLLAGILKNIVSKHENKNWCSLRLRNASISHHLSVFMR